MKAKLTKPDGTVIEVEGTQEEINRIVAQMRANESQEKPAPTPEGYRLLTSSGFKGVSNSTAKKLVEG